jgi:RNA polymerase sigma-70 factor (ECF subfamily)
MHRRAPTEGRPRGDGRRPRGALTAEEFAARFQQAARVLWAVAAGVLGESSQVEDVLQESAVIALGKLEDFETGSNFTAWMARVVRFVALNHARRQRRRATTPVDPLELDLDPRLCDAPRASENGRAGAARPSPIGARGELPADQADFDDRLLAALTKLRPTARACLLLRVVEELDYKEIAAVLGIPEGTAMSHVHRSRAALRLELGGDGVPQRSPLGSTGEAR